MLSFYEGRRGKRIERKEGGGRERGKEGVGRRKEERSEGGREGREESRERMKGKQRGRKEKKEERKNRKNRKKREGRREKEKTQCLSANCCGHLFIYLFLTASSVMLWAVFRSGSHNLVTVTLSTLFTASVSLTVSAPRTR